MARRWPDCAIIAAWALALWLPAAAQAADPFQSAPGPAATPSDQRTPFISDPGPAPPAPATRRPPPRLREAAPAPRPEIPQPVVVPVPAPPVVLNQSWEGTTGIWHVKATISGQKVTGRIECYRVKKGNWSGWGPTFEGTIDTAGNISALTAPWAPWVDRKISGTLPNLNIEAASSAPNTPLDCPNGRAELKKLS